MSGKTSQSCFILVQTVRAGAGKCGSAKAPTATQTMSGRRSFSQKTVEPHLGQKWKASQVPLSAWRRKVLRSPSVAAICSRGKKALAPNTEPVRRWQARQWHDETMLGAPVMRMRNWPQAQAASRSTDPVMPTACHRLVSQARRQDADNRRIFHESWEHGGLPRRFKLRVGPTIVIGGLTLVLCVSISLLYVGWQPGSSLSLTGFIAMALGLLAAILLGVGLVLLIHHDKRRD
jgi:hypothetical protein